MELEVLQMPLLTYRLKYTRKTPKLATTYTTETPVFSGSVIEIGTGDFRYVAKIKKPRFGYKLVLSGSLDTNERSYLLAVKEGVWKKRKSIMVNVTKSGCCTSNPGVYTFGAILIKLL